MRVDCLKHAILFSYHPTCIQVDSLSIQLTVKLSCKQKRVTKIFKRKTKKRSKTLVSSEKNTNEIKVSRIRAQDAIWVILYAKLLTDHGGIGQNMWTHNSQFT